MPDDLILPTRPLQAGERWDLVRGKFLATGEQAHGTVRYVYAGEPSSCCFCPQPIVAGQEVDEDFVRCHAKCGIDQL